MSIQVHRSSRDFAQADVRDRSSQHLRGGPWDYDILAPDPAGTIEFLSALGYTLESAVADLVDNSVVAGANHVDVIFQWAGLAGGVKG